MPQGAGTLAAHAEMNGAGFHSVVSLASPPPSFSFVKPEDLESATHSRHPSHSGSRSPAAASPDLAIHLAASLRIQYHRSALPLAFNPARTPNASTLAASLDGKPASTYSRPGRGKPILELETSCWTCGEPGPKLVVRGEKLDWPAKATFSCIACAAVPQEDDEEPPPEESEEPTYKDTLSAAVDAFQGLEEEEDQGPPLTESSPTLPVELKGQALHCDVCSRLIGAGKVTAVTSGKAPAFTTEVVCARCQKLYKPCSDCGGGEVHRIEDVAPSTAEDLEKKCREVYFNSRLGVIARPDSLERGDGLARTFLQVERGTIDQWHLLAPLLQERDMEASQGRRRYLAIQSAPQQGRRPRGKVEVVPTIDSGDSPPPSDRSMTGFMLVEHDLANGTLLWACSMPWVLSGPSFDASTELGGLAVQRARADLFHTNREREAQGLAPFPPIQYLWLLSPFQSESKWAKSLALRNYRPAAEVALEEPNFPFHAFPPHRDVFIPSPFLMGFQLFVRKLESEHDVGGQPETPRKKPMPTSLSGEIEQEMGRQDQKSAALDLEDDLLPHSLLFPSVPPPHPTGRSPYDRNPSVNHRRTLSAASASAVNHNRYSSASSNYDGGVVGEEQDHAAALQEQYGAEADAETRSIFIGGSRPPSTLRQTGQRNHHRASTAFSIASEAETIASASALGYLFLSDPGDESATSPSDNNMSPIPDIAPTLRNVTRSTAGERSSSRIRSMHVSPEGAPPVPAIPAEIYGGTNVHYKGESQHFNSEEAWYFLRHLVGEELKAEEGMLWRLRSLVGDEQEDMFAGTDSDELDYVDAREIPVLRYLIRHFLLTLPLIRDTAGPDEEIPDFWTSGLHVLIRKVHDADLSHDVDTSSTSLGSTIYGTFVRHALERFVSAGLKLSSGQTRAGANPLVGLAFAPRDAPMSPTVLSPPERGASNMNGAQRESRRFSIGKLMRGSGPNTPTLSPALSQSPTVVAVAPRPKPLDIESVKSRTPLAEATRRTSNSRSDLQDEEPVRTRSASRQTGNTSARSRDDASFHSAREGDESRGSGTSGTSDSEASEFEPPERANKDFGDSSPEFDNDAAETKPSAPWFSWLPGGESVQPRNDLLLPVTPPAQSTSAPEPSSPSPDKALPFPPRATSGSRRLVASEIAAAKPYVIDDAALDDFNTLLQGHSKTSKTYFPAHGDGPSSPTDANGALRTLPPRSTSRGPAATPTATTAVADKKDTIGRRFTSSFHSLLKKKSSSNLGSPTSPTLSAFVSSTSPTVPSPVFPSPILGVGQSFPGQILPSSPREPFSPTLGSSAPHGGSIFDALPASRRPPAVSAPVESWVAALGIPEDVEMSSPVTSAPLAVDLVAKGGVPWPFGAPVPFWRGAPYQKLKWGGFETDIVAVRSTLFSKTFIIRVRRPGRLDEYVARSDAQFQKYYKILHAQYPDAQLRKVPIGDTKEDQLIRAKVGARPLSSVTARSSMTVSPPDMGRSMHRQSASSGSRLAAGLREAAEDPSSKRPVSSFARSITSQSLSGDAGRLVKRRRATLSHARPQSMSSMRTNFTIPAHLSTPILKRLPPHDPHRRALRNWLRDTLSVRTVGHHKETAAFLLLGSIVPRQADIKDLRQREAVDDARRAARVAVAQGSAQRAKTMRDAWASVEEECIHGNGFANISEALRTSATIEKLPSRYVKTIDWMRMGFAETLYETLVTGNSSSALFSKLKSLHASFPYFLVRQAFKISKSKLMAKVLQDILLARPFGTKSLLQKILATCLDDDPAQILSQISRYRSRINSSALTEKLDRFVYESPEHKNIVRTYAQDNNIELVICILRGADEPRLPAAELERVVQAGVAYRKFMKKRPSQLAKAKTDDMDIRLVLDCQMYLRLISQDRDANSIRQMLADESTAAALEVVAGPFVALLQRTYRFGAGAALTDLQKAIDQLIIIVEALRSRVQDPQKAVRILGRLLARHQQSLYTFIHAIHCGDSIVEEFLQWGWTASVFLRRGLAQTIDLDALIPQDVENQAYLFDELQDLVHYQHKKRLRQYQNACRRYAGDVDADDPVIVEGDGLGKSQLDAHIELKPRCPPIIEIPACLDAFRHQLKQVFAV
ncbi:hypothetical protein RQP46_000273 [Phenoliferia psychrophenolica]